MNQWVGPPPKDINMAGAGSNKTGWEEPSPPAQRRNLPNYDDGTSLWGNPAQQQGRMGGMCGFTHEVHCSMLCGKHKKGNLKACDRCEARVVSVHVNVEKCLGTGCWEEYVDLRK